MSVYIDTSVLVAAMLNETNSPKVRAWWKGLSKPAIIADLTSLEYSVVIMRAVRAGQFSDADAAKAFQSEDALRSGCLRISHDQFDYVLAEQIVRDASTKRVAADALPLATAIRAGATLATFYIRLAEAERSRGLEVEHAV